MLSGSKRTSDIVAALRAGVEGWITKDGDLDEVLLAATQVLEGHLHLPLDMMKPVVHALLEESETVVRSRGFLDGLTQRQVDVLRCLVAGMSRNETAAHLFLSANTVRTHVQNMLHQLGLHSTPAARRGGPAGRSHPGTRTPGPRFLNRPDRPATRGRANDVGPSPRADGLPGARRS